jgi:8-oxo-dGTP pyrophosphatase MutT (NUDIX family)
MLKIPKRVGPATTLWQGPFPNKLVTEQSFELPGGEVEPYYLWGRPKPSVLLVPITAEGNVIVTRQWRPGLLCKNPQIEWVYEFPGGHPKPGQTAAGAAADELMEETGYALDPNNVFPLGNSWLDPPSNSAVFATYLLLDCKKVGEPKPEHGEILERVIVPFDDWFRECFSGEPLHRDSKTITAMGLALPMLAERGLVLFGAAK